MAAQLGTWCRRALLSARRGGPSVRLGPVCAACAGASCALALGMPTSARVECSGAAGRRAAATAVVELPERRFRIDELVVGDGDGPAVDGAYVSIHYRVTVAESGDELDRTRDAPGFLDRMFGEPAVFKLGDLSKKRVIGGIHEAVRGMHVGGKRVVRMVLKDPEFGYDTLPPDTQGRPIILHPWTDLIIEVELVSIALAAEHPAEGRLGIAGVLDSLRAQLALL